MALDADRQGIVVPKARSKQNTQLELTIAQLVERETVIG